MKRSISLVLCLAMLISVFSCIGVTASAAGDPQKLFTVKRTLKNDVLTYTVYINKNTSFSGATIYAEYDKTVLSPVKTEYNNAYMVDDGDGGVRENVSGMYEADPMIEYDNRFSVVHVSGGQNDIKIGSSNKAYMEFVFKVIDKNRPETEVKLFCYEFYSVNEPEKNIKQSFGNEIISDTVKTLGATVYKEIVSTKDGVLLTWEKTTGADEYEISKNGKVVKTVDASVTSFEDTDVKNNVKYTYAVRAKNEAGYDFAKEEISTRYTVAPSKITLSNEDGKVEVSWKAVDGATGYRVYRRTIDSKGTKSKWEYISKKITSRSYTDTKVKSGTKYEYAVRVYSDGGNSDLYSEKEILYLAIPEFSVEATVKGVKITWEKVAGAESYKIYRKISDGSWKEYKTISASKTSYTDTSASSGKTNSYKVVAVKDSYNSDYETDKVYYLKTPTVSVKNTTSGVYSSWKKVSGASSYEVYRKAGSAKSWKKIATTKKTSYTDKTVKSGTTYKYTIRAVNSKGKSKYGSTAYETIRFLSAPKLENITSTKSGVTIYWDDVKGASKYLVYRKTGSGDYELIKTVSGKSTVKYLDKTAKKGKTYTYKVYAGYSSYKSSYKSTLSIKDKY